MVYSIRWRTQAQKILLSLILFTYADCAHAELYVGLSRMVFSERGYPKDLRGGVKDNIYYDRSRGAFVGTREIQYSQFEDRSEYIHWAISTIYIEDEWDSGLTINDRAVNLTLGSSWWYFLYGVQWTAIDQKYEFDIEHHKKEYYCAVSCGYVSTLTAEESESEKQKREEYLEYTSVYLGGFYTYDDFYFRSVVGDQVVTVFIGYNFD